MRKKQVLELIEEYSLLGDTFYMDVIFYMQNLNLTVIEPSTIFEGNGEFSRESLKCIILDDEFKHMSFKEIKAETSKYPI